MLRATEEMQDMEALAVMGGLADRGDWEVTRVAAIVPPVPMAVESEGAMEAAGRLSVADKMVIQDSGEPQESLMKPNSSVSA